MDAMRQSRKYTMAYGISWIWVLILMIPHTTAIALCFNQDVLEHSNVYAILPDTIWRTMSIWIMLVRVHSLLLYSDQVMTDLRSSQRHSICCLGRTSMVDTV